MDVYNERVNYIQSLRRFGEASGYEVSTELLSLLDHPEQDMKVVHIAGTNGKGSTAAFITNILARAGLRTGLFTSPHLISFRERIRVINADVVKPENGFDDMISEEDVVRLSDIVLNAAEGLPERLSPTMFDICLAMALLYFKEKECEYIVLETGLGGRLDSTSALDLVPEVSVITGIGIEHTQYLGNTLEEIAFEKAGILKRGTMAVIGDMAIEATEVIVNKCIENGIPFFFANDMPLDKKGYSPGLFGEYQKKNAACAVCAAGLLGIEDETVISEGLAGTRFPGRMDIISKEPLIILDGAHNPDGVQALVSSLKAAFPDQRFIMISAVLEDKEHEVMLELIKPVCRRLICTGIDQPRALSPEDYAAEATGIGIDATAESDFTKALSSAKIYKESIVIFGSLYFVGFCYEKMGVFYG